MKTKVFFEKYKGYDVLAIWQVDDADNKVGQYPIISFGKPKATAISKHLDELKEFGGAA